MPIKRIQPPQKGTAPKLQRNFMPLEGEHGTWEEYWELVSPRLKARAEGFKVIFDHLEKHFHIACPPVIVETGTLREPNNYEGDGCSTLLFDTFIEYFDGKLCSVDIDPEACFLAAAATINAEVVNSDSVAYLNSFEDEIDILYLDSYNIEDWNFDWPAATHHLKELFAAYNNLSPGSLVVIDDNVRNPHTNNKMGKGRIVREFLGLTGKATLLHDGYQEIWAWHVG